MKLAFLSPFSSEVLVKYLPESTIDKLPKGMGGSAVFELVTGLIDRGVEVHLITLHPGISTLVTVHSKNLHYYIVPRRSKGATRDIWKNERAIIFRLLTKIKPQVIHAHWTYEYALAAIDYNARISLITAHDIPFEVLRYSRNIFYFPLFLVSYFVYHKARWISFVSNAIIPYAKPVIKNNTNYYTIPNIVSINDYFTKLLPRSKMPDNYFLSIGNWGPLKNIKAGIKSFNRYLKEGGNKNYHYVLIGPGLSTNDISYKWAKKNQLLTNVIFMGHCSRVETLQILKKAYALLHLSKTESFGLAVGEAMYLGVPVIGGKKSGAIPQILGKGKFGTLVDVNNIKEIVRAMLSIDRTKIDDCKNYIKTNYSSGFIVDKYISVYSNIQYKHGK